MEPVRPVRGVERRLAEEQAQKRDRECRERLLRPAGRPAESEPQADDRARHDDDPQRVHDEHRVHREPVREQERPQPFVRDSRVVAERASGAGGEEDQEHRPEQDEREPEPADEPADAPPLDHEPGDDEGQGEDDVLDPGERGERREPDERELRAA